MATYVMKGSRMKKQMQVSVVAVNDVVRFHASAPQKMPIVLDYFSPPEDEEGYSSLELLLISAASCLATAVKLIATRHFKRDMSSIEVKAVGIRRDDSPTEFIRMAFTLRCQSRDLDQRELESIVQNAEKNVCPVFAMLRDDIETEISAVVTKTSSEPALQKEV
jgi:uncharacterized OsmC-like protein